MVSNHVLVVAIVAVVQLLLFAVVFLAASAKHDIRPADRLRCTW